MKEQTKKIFLAIEICLLITGLSLIFMGLGIKKTIEGECMALYEEKVMRDALYNNQDTLTEEEVMENLWGDNYPIEHPLFVNLNDS